MNVNVNNNCLPLSMEKEFTDILDKVIKSAVFPAGLQTYVFICSKKWKCSIKEYRGVSVYYFALAPDDFVALLPSPYLKDYEKTN